MMECVKNKKSLPDRSPAGTNWGVGARHTLFPDATIGHPQCGSVAPRRHSPWLAELSAS